MRLLTVMLLMALGIWHFAGGYAAPVAQGDCHAAATAMTADTPMASHDGAPGQQQATSNEAQGICADLVRHACCTSPAVTVSSVDMPLYFDSEPPSQIVKRLEPQPPLPPFRPPTARLS